jgi:hypothetical protein
MGQGDPGEQHQGAMTTNRLLQRELTSTARTAVGFFGGDRGGQVSLAAPGKADVMARCKFGGRLASWPLSKARELE